ncbi:ABC transporter permease [Jiella sp. MQZ9-1]|uniref:ABC transporter permease n=1 Tax=Jiella flava TaxID=2816857 RepID=A0A939FZC1_9HYPH|nr:ABC transporter permease [Jiella flava]MBO0664272.1 ABC transporter permease [Jiella flava]MCD2472805.1 ABC transporter permease [Jiella flava]
MSSNTEISSSPQTTAGLSTDKRSQPARKSVSRPQEMNVLIGLVAIALIFEILGWIVQGESFLFNTQRLSIMILQVSVVGIIAVGVTQVIITGGIDLSSGSLVGATAMIAMSFAQASTYARAVYPSLTDLPVIVPIAIGLGCGILAGVVNGALIAYTKIPPFIATLGMMVFARGVAKWYTRGQPVSFPTDSYAAIGDGMNPVLIFLAVAIVFHVALRYTVYGKHTYAIGSNEQGARMSGINVERHLVLVYAIAGMLAALAAVVISSRNLTAQASFGNMYELDAIAMAVIGGVSLSGGRGSVPGTVLGALIFGVILSGFTFLRLDAYYQEMIKGVIIVAAVVADIYRQRSRAKMIDKE